MLLWDDNPTSLDLLGFESLAVPVRAALLRSALDPVCVGVFGAWGSGKTTVLNLVMQQLANDDGVLVVYTQPWAYDPTTDPKATLIGEVLGAIRGHLQASESLTEGLKKRLASLAQRVRWTRAIQLAARTALTAQLPDIDELAGLFGKDDEISDPTLEGFRDDFNDLLGDEEAASLVRVIVIVDDLDRCLPETVIDTLEAVKLFLSVQKMAFLIAADQEPVRHAIMTRYEGSEQSASLAERYLDKIVQIPLRLPVLGKTDVEAYIALLLLHERLNDDEFENVRQYAGNRRLSGERDLLDGLELDAEQGHQDVAMAKRLAPILYEQQQGNPRLIKRFLNAYWIRATIAASRGVDFDPSAFAKLMLLEQFYEEDFKSLLGWLSAGALADKIQELETGVGDHSQEMFRWGALEPSLQELELAPYLVLAASIFGTTVPDDSIPGHLRATAVGLVSNSDNERSTAQVEAAQLSNTDRSLLARHLAESVWLNPSHQDTLSESLAVVIGTEAEVAASAVPLLQKVSVSGISPALIVNLSPPGSPALEPIVGLLKGWLGNEDTPDDAANAIKLALGE